MEFKEFSFHEFERAFKMLKQRKAIGYNCLNGYVIIDACDSIKVFPNKLKIVKVAPFFKKGEKENFEKHRPISLLQVFSKVLELIMYIHLYEHLINDNHCVKRIRIQRFSRPYLPVFSSNEGKYGREKLRIRTLFTQ